MCGSTGEETRTRSNRRFRLGKAIEPGGEKEVISAADAMPEEKYSFAASDGEFKGARTFAQRVRRIGSATNMLFGVFDGEKADFELAEKGRRMSPPKHRSWSM